VLKRYDVDEDSVSETLFTWEETLHYARRILAAGMARLLSSGERSALRESAGEIDKTLLRCAVDDTTVLALIVATRTNDPHDRCCVLTALHVGRILRCRPNATRLCERAGAFLAFPPVRGVPSKAAVCRSATTYVEAFNANRRGDRDSDWLKNTHLHPNRGYVWLPRGGALYATHRRKA
jgi:hypothetical protein